MSAALTTFLSRKPLQPVGPGIPDIYQGTKLTGGFLIDSDNRRSVDYDAYIVVLDKVAHDEVMSMTKSQEYPAELPEGLIDADADVVKLMVIHHGIELHTERPESFVGGTYQPVLAVGVGERHLVGAARGPKGEPEDVVALVTHRPLGLQHEDGWGDATVAFPEGFWTDRFTGHTWSGTITVAFLLSSLPVALLVREDDDD